MSGVTVTTQGDKELAIRFEKFPTELHAALFARIQVLTATLEARVQAATPHLSGTLQSEETERTFGDVATRVAGYVGVYAPNDPTKEYPKAATLEYGTDRPRRAFKKGFGLRAGLTAHRKLIVGKLSKPVHIEAKRFLRASLESMRSDILAAFDDVINTKVEEANQ